MHLRLHDFLTQPLLSHSPGVSTKCAMCSFYFLAPQKIIWGLAPISVRRWKLHFPRYRLVKVSWKYVQPFPRMVVW